MAFDIAPPSDTPSAVAVEPLTADAFAPFGTVIAHATEGRRHFFPAAFEHRPEAVEPSFWVSRIEEAGALPMTVATLERHPFTAQTFLPLLGQPYLVVVAGTDGEGAPDLATARAFLAAPYQGVTYRCDVWHHGMTVTQGPAEFAVLMHRTGRGDDDVFLDLPHPFAVVAAAGGISA